MKKAILISFLLCVCNPLFSQVYYKELLKKTEEVLAKIDDTKPNGWTKVGSLIFLANQVSYTNWMAGGQGSVSGNIGLNYDLNYKNDTWNWDNKLIAGYGLNKLKGQELQKSDDRIQLSSLLGKKASGEWFYSAFFNFKSQFDSGFESGVKTSHFLSPVYVQFGPGMLWKKSNNLKINIAPLSSKLIAVDSKFTATGPSFGVEQGKSRRYEFGTAVNSYYKFVLMENVNIENILNLYSNYLDRPKNVDIDYTLNVAMKVNKYLSTNLAFQTIYDDNAFAGFQTRQVLGLGVNYDL